jgi:hypothetical protein
MVEKILKNKKGQGVVEETDSPSSSSFMRVMKDIDLVSVWTTDS